MNIAKLMIPKIYTVTLHENCTIRQGLEVLARCRYTAIPVLDEQDRYVGSVSEGDFLQHVLKTGQTDLRQQESYRIRDILRRDFCPALDIDSDFQVVVEAALKQNFVPVVDSRNALCGIVTRRNLIAAMAKGETK